MIDKKDNDSNSYYLNGIPLSGEQQTAEENDLFRKHLKTKDIVLSDGVATLDLDLINNVIQKIKGYRFTPRDVEVWDERLMGTIEYEGKEFLWSIMRDYKDYDFCISNTKLGIRLANEKTFDDTDVFGDIASA